MVDAPAQWAHRVTELSLEGAERVLWCALECAAELKAQVAISIVDQAGYVRCCARMDGAPQISVQIAADKARTAAQLKMATRLLQQTVDGERASYLSIGNLCPISGGYPITLGTEIIGAIGVSGATETLDHDIACHAAETFGEQVRPDVQRTHAGD